MHLEHDARLLVGPRLILRDVVDLRYNAHNPYNARASDNAQGSSARVSYSTRTNACYVASRDAHAQTGTRVDGQARARLAVEVEADHVALGGGGA